MNNIVIFLVSIFAVSTLGIQLNSTYEDFGQSMGIFNQQCQIGMATFIRDVYSNNFFPAPSDSTSEYFLTSDKPSCTQTPLLETSDEVNIEISSFSFREPTSMLYINVLNYNNTVLYTEIINFNNTSNWSKASVTLKTDDPFRIRLIYETGYMTPIFAIDYVNITLTEITTTEIPTTTEEPVNKTCIRDDFGAEFSGILGDSCGVASYSSMNISSYSNVRVPNRLLGGNDYFLSTTQFDEPSCSVSHHPIDVNENNEIKATVYTDNGGVAAKAFIFLLDAENPDVILQMEQVDIDDSRRWRTVTWKVKITGSILVQLFVEKLTNTNSILAVDSIGLKLVDGDDCTNACQKCTTQFCSKSYALIDESGPEVGGGFGTASIIVSTAVVVSLVWGGVMGVFIYRKRRNQKQTA